MRNSKYKLLLAQTMGSYATKKREDVLNSFRDMGYYLLKATSRYWLFGLEPYSLQDEDRLSKEWLAQRNEQKVEFQTIKEYVLSLDSHLDSIDEEFDKYIGKSY